MILPARGHLWKEKVKRYTFSTILDTPYEDAISRVKNAIKEEGFGVLTEIDVKVTLKKKLDKEFSNYVILGAWIHPLPTGPSTQI